MTSSRTQHGFTIIELLVVIVLALVAAGVFLTQKSSLDAAERDSQRKTAINAMYYSLEEDFYSRNRYYPEHIDSKTLRSMDPALFTDPQGHTLDTALGSYHYDGINCTDGKCKSYSLRATLEKEAEYKKLSRNN